MSNVVHFNFKQQDVRIQDQNGEAWFVLSDVCDVLGIVDHKDAARRLPEKGVGKTHLLTSGGYQQVSIINEPALYRLIFRSNKPEAEEFQTWVFEEVLPAIRKTGVYHHPAPETSKPDIGWEEYTRLIKIENQYLRERSRPKRKAYSMEEKAQILNRFRLGHTCRAIAADFDRSISSVENLKRTLFKARA